MKATTVDTFGPIALFGSGETSPMAQRIHHEVMTRLDPPVRAAILETPAGFEPNSDKVAQRIADYLKRHLRNFDPQTTLIPARSRNSSFNPDNPDIASALFDASYIFMGPGSPTYAVRQLRDSYTWHAMLAQHRLGAAICFSSATTIAVSNYALPVYEIYKVGEDLHWKPGLDFFSHFGLDLMITPHWNNNDGGDELDTSRCYMGQARYSELLALLPSVPTILGIEENTGVVIDPLREECTVVGVGAAIILRDAKTTRFESGSKFNVNRLGNWRLPTGSSGLPESVWNDALAAKNARDESNGPPSHIDQLIAEREAARARQDWQEADRLRESLYAQGWQIMDTPNGPVASRIESEQISHS